MDERCVGHSQNKKEQAMKKIATLAASVAIAAGILVAPALLATPAYAARAKLTGEERLAKLLDGREAGNPVSCIPVSQTDNTTVIDKTAIVYKVGRTLYVNRPRNPDSLDDDDLMVTRLYGSQLCRLDTVQMHDRTFPRMWNGFVALGEFVPYRKAPTAN